MSALDRQSDAAWCGIRLEEFSCEIPASLLFLSHVKRLKTVVSLIVLALWSACTINCEIVNLAAAEMASCCDEQDGKEQRTPAQPDRCVCGWIRSGGYIAEKTVVPLPLPVDLPLFAFPGCVEVPMPDAAASELIFSPPEFLTSWQFSYRAALSPRAPSFVS